MQHEINAGLPGLDLYHLKCCFAFNLFDKLNLYGFRKLIPMKHIAQNTKGQVSATESKLQNSFTYEHF